MGSMARGAWESFSRKYLKSRLDLEIPLENLGPTSQHQQGVGNKGTRLTGEKSGVRLSNPTLTAQRTPRRCISSRGGEFASGVTVS